jgi:HEAT repeat protein
MNNLTPLARSFSHLVWLLAHRADEQEQQKEALRVAVGELVARKQDIMLVELTLALANGPHAAELDELFTWVSELCVRMSAHAVRAIEFLPGATAYDVLGIARALASAPAPGDDGAAFDEKVVALAPKTLAIHIGRQGFVRRETPSLAHAPTVAPTRTPPMGIQGVVSDGIADSQVPPSLIADESFSQGAGYGIHATSGHGIADDTLRILHSDVTPGLTPAPRLKDLLERLDNADAATATKLIDDVAREAEERAREGLFVDLALVLDRLHCRSDALREGDLKRGYHLAIRRLEKPALLQGIAQLLPRRREIRDLLTGLLARAGEAGADALIDLLVISAAATERRAYRAALAQCPAAVPALSLLLGDGRWYVVRNAVELLAELSPADADAQLPRVLGHGEPRVRRAVVNALTKLGTPRAVLTLLQAAQDPSPEVRAHVALGLGAIRNPRAVPWLVEAFDREQDKDVQAAIVTALGKMPTEDAIARLARAAEPGGLLLRKSSALRLLAVDALAEAGTPSALAVLRGLLHDRDRDVREAASRLISAPPRALEQ